MAEELCPCGRPLHYSRPDLRLLVEALVKTLGPSVAIHTAAGSWLVPRHYIALHGIRSEDLPMLADLLGFQRTHSTPTGDGNPC